MKTLADNIRGQWLSWAAADRHVLAATAVVGASTMAVNLMLVVRDIGVAHIFGRGDAVDAFLIAFLAPSFALNVIAGSFGSAFIPAYVRVRDTEGEEAAQRLFSGVTAVGLLLLVAVAALLAVSIDRLLPLLASGFDETKRALTRSLVLLLLPLTVLGGLASLWSSVLNARKRFIIAALVPALQPLTALAGLAFSNAWGIRALAAGTVLGSAFQCAFLAAALRQEHIRPFPRWHGLTPELRGVIGQYLPMLAGALLMSMTGLVDQAMAAMLDPGSVASLSYGTKVVTFATALGTMAIGTAVLPHFSQMAGEKDWQGVRRTLRVYSRAIVIATVPFVVLLVLLREPLVSILFERGAFGGQDVHIVGNVLALAALQVPFYLLAILYVRLISSLRKNSVLLWGAAISLPLNAALNLVFMRWMGIAGIALSTSVVYAVSCLYVYWMLQRELEQCER